MLIKNSLNNGNQSEITNIMCFYYHTKMLTCLESNIVAEIMEDDRYWMMTKEDQTFIINKQFCYYSMFAKKNVKL